MSVTHDLEKLLGDASLPLELDERLRDLSWKVCVEMPTTIARWFQDEHPLPYGPLARRGLLAAFDGEGGYFERNKHAELAQYLLARSGLEDTVAEDRLVDGLGLVLSARIGKHESQLLEPNAHASDYAFAGLVVAVCNEILAATHHPIRLIHLTSEDQGVFIAFVPAAQQKAVARSLRELVEPSRARALTAAESKRAAAS